MGSYMEFFLENTAVFSPERKVVIGRVTKKTNEIFVLTK